MTTHSPKIDPALWPEVSRRFDEALDLPPAARPAWLSGLVPAVAQAVQRLLEADASTQDPSGSLGGWVAQALARFEAGQVVGPYRLEALLGEGGMAQVWRAQALSGLNRRIALKLPRPGDGLAQRFAQERDLLASLEHPHIARLYDAGMDGEQPWLAMECVQGQSVDVWAGGRTLAERLRLFLQVLAAVAYAHQRLVVHCDLKPANLLVTAEGHLRLLDFGIAGLLGQGAGEQLAFSADSAAPEQLDGAAPSTAMDVHALGVLLYELLCGERPYHLPRAPRAQLAAQRRAWVWQAPSRREGGQAERGDAALDAIVARALHTDPAQRYPSCEALREDLLRWQRHEPVLAFLHSAQPAAQRCHRLRCWLRRNRLLALSGAAVAAALLAGLALALAQAHEASAQARRAEAAQRFLVDLFKAASPEQRLAGEPSVRELLARGSQRLANELQGEPELRAALHLDLARIHSQLGDNAQALAQAREARQLLALTGSGDSEAALDADYLVMEALKEESQFDEADTAAQALQARAQRLFGAQHRWRLPVVEQRAFMANQQGDAAKAESLVREALQHPASQHEALSRLRLLAVLGTALLDQARFAEAAAAFEAVVSGSARLPDYERTDQLTDRYNLARARYLQGQLAVAAALLEQTVAQGEQHLGRAHDRVLKARSLWAQVLSQQGKPLQAVALQRDSLAAAESRPAFDDSQLSLQRLTLAKLLRQAHRPEEGLSLARAGLKFLDAQQSAPTWLRERARWILGELLQAQGDVAGALAAFDTAERHMAQLSGRADHPSWAELLLSRALVLQRRGQPGDAARAQEDARVAEALLRRVQGPDSPGARLAQATRLWLAGDATGLAALQAAWPQATPLQRAGLQLWQAELLGAGGPARTPARLREAERLRAQAAEPWQAATGQALPERLLTLP
ncbi:MAG: protein kinase domain-containing protein [Rubrivivax sp.]